jgi:hypothetical protein
MPACKRDRELAASHASIVGGMAAMGVAVNSITGVTVKEGRGAVVIAEVLAGDGVFVLVGEAIGIIVAVLVMAGKVTCEDDVGFTATAGVRDGELAVAIVAVGGTAPVGDSGMDVGDSDRGMAS